MTRRISFFPLLVLLGSLPSFLSAQSANKFTIKGHLEGFQVEWIYLNYEKNHRPFTDSARVVDGNYQLSGELGANGTASLYAYNPGTRKVSGRTADFFLGPEQFSITHWQKLSNIKITGSRANDDYNEVMKEFRPLSDAMNAFQYKSMEVKKQGDSLAWRATMRQRDSVEEVIKEKYLDFARSHRSSLVDTYLLSDVFARELKAENVIPAFKELDKSVRESASGQLLLSRLSADTLAIAGAMAKDFTENDTLDKPVTLSSFRGKYVFLDFWASWCGPCHGENPNVLALYNKYHSRGLEGISVSMDSPGRKSSWLYAIHLDHLAWTQISDLKGGEDHVANLYGVEAIPQNFLIDPNGKIIAKNLRGTNLEKKLIEILGN